MRLSNAPRAYDIADQNAVRRALEQADDKCFHKGRHLLLQNGELIVLESPNGSLFSLTVADDGTLTTTAYP